MKRFCSRSASSESEQESKANARPGPPSGGHSAAIGGLRANREASLGDLAMSGAGQSPALAFGPVGFSGVRPNQALQRTSGVGRSLSVGRQVVWDAPDPRHVPGTAPAHPSTSPASHAPRVLRSPLAAERQVVRPH